MMSAVFGMEGKVPAIISLASFLNASSVIWSLVGVHDLLSKETWILEWLVGKYNSFTLSYFGFGLYRTPFSVLRPSGVCWYEYFTFWKISFCFSLLWAVITMFWFFFKRHSSRPSTNLSVVTQSCLAFKIINLTNQFFSLSSLMYAFNFSCAVFLLKVIVWEFLSTILYRWDKRQDLEVSLLIQVVLWRDKGLLFDIMIFAKIGRFSKLPFYHIK